MYIVGLTGGIGSGKSTAARYFAGLGVPVVDADEIGRELTAPGQPALNAITAAFGPGLVGGDGRLDRARLRRIAFASPAQRRRLEALLHPSICRVLRERLAAAAGPYALACIPLLIETGPCGTLDRVLVIDAPEAAQRQRLRTRSGFSAADIDAIIRSQATREARLAAADDVILNTGTLEALLREVGALHQRYLRLAAAAAIAISGRVGEN